MNYEENRTRALHATYERNLQRTLDVCSHVRDVRSNVRHGVLKPEHKGHRKEPKDTPLPKRVHCK